MHEYRHVPLRYHGDAIEQRVRMDHEVVGDARARSQEDSGGDHGAWGVNSITSNSAVSLEACRRDQKSARPWIRSVSLKSSVCGFAAGANPGSEGSSARHSIAPCRMNSACSVPEVAGTVRSPPMRSRATAFIR